MTTPYSLVQYPALVALAALVACASGPPSTVRPLTSAERADPATCASLGTSDTLWNETELDTALTVIAFDPPHYPVRLRDDGTEGHARFSFVIQPTGRVDPCSLILLEATDPEFATEARKALLGVRFASPRRLGRAVSVDYAKTIRFRLGQVSP